MMTRSEDHLETIDTLHQQLLEEQQRRTELERELHHMHNFVRRAGHDLKTPLTTLKTSLYLIQRKSALATEERLSMMEGQLDRLSRLVDSMGLMARLEDIRDLELNERDICNVVKEAIWAIETLASESEIAIHVQYDDDLPALQLNFEELKRAIVNVLDNAVRYSPEKTPIQVHVYEMHGHVCVDVIDYGVGMDKNEVEQLFQRFYRGADAGTINDQGAGMGLPIMQRIVDLHGGKIRVNSTLGKGSTFRIMLPIQ